MWTVETQIENNIGKIDVTTNPLPVSLASTFKLEIRLQDIRPAWNFAGYLNIASGNQEIILYSTQKILLKYENLIVTTNLETGSVPRPELIRFVFTPVAWVKRVEYSFVLYRYTG